MKWVLWFAILWLELVVVSCAVILLLSPSLILKLVGLYFFWKIVKDSVITLPPLERNYKRIIDRYKRRGHK